MIKATRKSLEEIFTPTKGFNHVLVVGCGGCTSVCLAGGQRETLELADEAAATTFTRRLLERGFIIRPLASFGMPSHVRISVGMEREIERVLDAVAAVVRADPRLCQARPGA